MKLNELPASNLVALTVCVIGRNEGHHLRTCASSLRQLDQLQAKYETIFIDSASTDRSIEIAKECFGQVVCLAPSKDLNAGAARNVGTAQAAGKWVLYLDGDMELAPDLIPIIKALVHSDQYAEGLCGFTENVYPDGERGFIRHLGNRDGSPCRSFGGAVLLPRSKVIEAGNWSCALYAYEETELYSRLLATGVRVKWYDRRLAIHKTAKFGLATKLRGAVIPTGSYLGKKFFGAGQVTRLTIQNGNFRQFLRLKPEAYVMPAGVLAAIAAAPILEWGAAAIPALGFAFNSARLGFKGAVAYTCWLSQLLFGLWKLNVAFQPRVERIFAAASTTSNNNK